MRIAMKARLPGICVCVAVLWGCTPGLDSALNLESLPEKQIVAKLDPFQPVPKVRVDKFLDSRESPILGAFRGQDLRAQGDLGLGVQRAFESQLKSSGAKLALFDGPQISGEIKSWKVEIQDSFPSVEVSAAAQIALRVLDEQGHPIYNARYGGEFAERNPFFSKEKVEDVLGQAMAEAIYQAVTDQEFLNKITR